MEDVPFLTDIYMPDTLFALTLRSPVAKGQLKSIECPKLPENYALIKASDIPGKNSFDESGIPVLADTELSYIGEPVALLLGPDKNLLEHLSKHCRVVYEKDEAVFNASLSEMIGMKDEMRIGEIEECFDQAASVMTDTYTTGIQDHWYAEPIGAVSWLEKINGSNDPETNALDAIMVVRTATQWPFHVKRSVEAVLGQQRCSVQVKPTDIGLHMDGKLWYPSLIACHVALGTWITKKPVRLFLTRKEDFSFSPKRCGTEISIKSALDEKGSITGIDINASVNIGAYGVNQAEILESVKQGCCGLYNIKNIRFSGTIVRTNIPPQGAFAGFGLAQGLFALERHISHIADTLKIDPAQWRQENVFAKKDTPFTEQLINTVMKMSDYRRKWATYELIRHRRKQHSMPDARHENFRGIGIALGCQANGLQYSGDENGNYGIELVLDKDGALDINTSAIRSAGDNSIVSVWQAMASEILGMEKEMVRVNCGSEFPDAGPLTASRSITVITKLIEQSCLEIRTRRFRDPLPINVRTMAEPQKKNQGSNMAGSGWASAIVELEIDPIEYLPRIRGIWLCVDGGRIISLDNARRTLQNSSVQALGWAYKEQVNYVAGFIPADQFDNYDIPGVEDIPPVAVEFISDNKSEPKGIGDLPFACIPAAYMQAVSQAMDRHFCSIPLKALDIWWAGKQHPAEGTV